MKIEILAEAELDLVAGFYFYERQREGLGQYFRDALTADVDSLMIYAGIHPINSGYYRFLSPKFPYAIYYKMEGKVISVYAILHTHMNPATIQARLT
jgi:plasmid stabilization system protein ParE